MSAEEISRNSKRIVFATLGSLGDLHPCLGLAIELKRRGHQITIASTPFYREKVEALGLRFCPLRPDWNPADNELIRRCEELKRGPEILFRQLILPHLRDTYEDLLAAVAGADLMLAGEIVYAAPLIAEKLKLSWISIILSPSSFFSSHDPSVLVNVPWLIALRRLGWRAYRAGIITGKLATRHWWEPVRDLRRKLGLPIKSDPLFRDKFSPDLVLALFSDSLGRKQVDWPVQTRQPGFVFYDRGSPDSSSMAELEAFLCAGEAPIVFTLGSTVVQNPGNFFAASADAARSLGRRAVLVGAGPEFGSEQILTVPYAPYSGIFPCAAAIVHQGGSGTTGQALRAGKPQLIVPYAWDQPDNGARIKRLGAGITIPRKTYSAKTAATALRRLTSEPHFYARAEEASQQIQREDAVKTACDLVESRLR